MSEPEARLVATGSQTIGPFFHVGPGCSEQLGRLATEDTPGEAIRLRLHVVDGDGVPVPDALVEVWQADADGCYAAAPPSVGDPSPAFTGFGRLGTNQDGWCTFETIRPGAVRAGSDRPQAPHLNVCLFARGLMRHLYTRVYFAGDPALADDPLLSLVPEDRRATLLAQPGDPGTWSIVVRLQGEDETVFFDL
jgi:protocatechuate 3,4-dioxygenase, alpha subunit